MSHLLTFGLVCALPMGAALADDFTSNEVSEYEVRFDRPMAVGQQFRVDGHGSMSRSLTAANGGQAETIESSAISVAFIGTSVITAIDAQNQPSSIQYTLESCSYMQDGNSQEFLANGSVITATRSATGTSFMVNGAAPHPEHVEALQLVFALPPADVSDDDVFGSDQPRAIGESWAMNSRKFADLLQASTGQPSDPDKVSGLTTLIDEQEYKGVPCLVMYTHLSTESIVPGLGALPAGVEIAKARTTAVRQGLFPKQSSLPVLSESNRFEVTADLKVASSDMPYDSMQLSAIRLSEISLEPLANARMSDASSANEMAE